MSAWRTCAEMGGNGPAHTCAYDRGVVPPESKSAYRVIRDSAFDTLSAIATGWVRGYLVAGARPSELPNAGFGCVQDG